MKVHHNIKIREVPEYAKALKARRIELGIKQEVTASHLEISPMGLSHYENGTRIPRTDKLEKWAEILDCDLVITIKTK